MQSHPFGTQIRAADIQAILTPLAGWEDRYRQVIQWGKQLPALDTALKNDANKVNGCEVSVWLHWECQGDAVLLAADADARIVKGLVCLVLAAFHGKTRAEIAAFDFDAYFTSLGLAQHLTPTRNNGIHAIVSAIKAI
uniref:SufE family protein n=1 Tax=Thaumasiovibrio occultus TaxID=1891184 RepID=UPI000B351822|nr:SufE family protein [Thaumasiovibrio occultus]